MNSLNHKIEANPEFSFLTVEVPEGEKLKVESAAVCSMDTNLKMKVRAKGGFKRLLTGENLFLNEFWAKGEPEKFQLLRGLVGILFIKKLMAMKFISRQGHS